MKKRPKGKQPSRLEASSIGGGFAMLVLLLWAGWMQCAPLHGTVVNDPFKFDGDLQAVRIVTRVQNGSDFVPVDSSTVTVFPKDTTVTLNDTANWRVLIGALWTGETDTVWNTVKRNIKDPFPILNEILDTLQNLDDWIAHQSSIDSVGNTVDLLMLSLGYGANAHSKKGRSGDLDTLHIMNSEDTLWQIGYWHLGGVTGNTPDSVTVL